MTGLDTKADEKIRVVTSNNFFKASGLEKTSLKARKLLYLAISQCKKSDTEFFTYSIRASDFARIMNISRSHVYEEADRITDELMHGFIKYVPVGEKKFKKFQLFETCEYTEDAEIKFKMSKDMTPILLNIKKDFTKPCLIDFMKMNSNYSIEVWHLMQREMHSKKPFGNRIIEFDLMLDELRFCTGTENKFKQIVQFKERVLDKAIREIKECCNIVITYENIKKGRSIKGFHFIAKSIRFDDSPEMAEKYKRAELVRQYGKLKSDGLIHNVPLEEYINQKMEDDNLEGQMELDEVLKINNWD